MGRGGGGDVTTPGTSSASSVSVSPPVYGGLGGLGGGYAGQVGVSDGARELERRLRERERR